MTFFARDFCFFINFKLLKKMDKKASLNVAEVKAATMKKPYIKPDFEEILLESNTILLAASAPVSPTGTGSAQSQNFNLGNLFE